MLRYNGILQLIFYIFLSSVNSKALMQDPNHSAMSTLPATAPPLNATKPDNTIPQAPPLIRPNKCCQIRYINGKRICPENTKSPEECMQEAQMKAERRKQELANVAMEAVKAAAKRPEKPEECIKTVDPKEQQCLVKKLQEKAKKKPKYVVSNNSNEVRIFNGNDLIFIAMRIQSHYAKHEPKKAIPSTVKNYDNAIMFNEAGDVVATKTKKNKPKPQDCICPTPSEPPVTKEGLLSECFKPTCKTAGILSEIVSNSTVTNVKDDQKDDKDKDKDDGKSKIKPQDKK